MQSEHKSYQKDTSESEDDDSKDEEEEFVEQTMERVQAEEERSMDELSVNISEGDKYTKELSIFYVSCPAARPTASIAHVTLPGPALTPNNFDSFPKSPTATTYVCM
eukprot:9421577-Ditylum_brightwellii.AAC.1